MYPYFQPPMKVDKKQELDTELLKIYGLDRFSVIDEQEQKQSITSDKLISKTNGNSGSSSKNWTQFD